MPRFSANISMLFAERPLLDRFQAAADAGFGAIEIQFPYDTPVDGLLKAKQDAGLDWSVFNLPVGDMLDGGPGLAAMPGREADFQAAVAQALPYAEALKPVNVNILSGFPPVDEVGREACAETLVANARHAADAMAEIGVGVVVEAVNTRDRPGFFLSASAEALDIVERAGHPNLGLEHDLYHMHIMEGRLIERLGEIMDRIGHIQFADAPGRHEPGTGEIGFEPIFRAIDDLGYRGWVAAEYVPGKPRTEDTLGWLAPWL